MAITRTVIGSTLPIKIEAVRNYLKLDDDRTDDDLLNTLQLAAIDYVAGYCAGLCFRVDTYVETFDAWADEIFLSADPLVSVTSVKYKDADNAEQTVSSSLYAVDLAANKIDFKAAFTSPTLGEDSSPKIYIQYTAGLGTSANMPAHARVLLLMLIAHWYENREAVLVGTVSKSIELSAQSMLSLLDKPKVF